MSKQTEDFLKSIGQRTSGYDYLGKEPKFNTEDSDKSVTLNGSKVPLNKKLLNYKELEEFIFGNSEVGLRCCIESLDYNKGNYSQIFFNATAFLSDLLKYADKCIPDDVELIESLFIRTCNIVNEKSDKLFKDRDESIKEAEFDINATLTERQMKSIQDAENNRLVSFTYYPSKNIFGDPSGIISVYESPRTDISSEMKAHRDEAKMMKEITKNSAQEVLNEKLVEMISDELTTFALNFEDVFVKRRTDLFPKIDYRSKDIKDCPYKYISYIENEKINKEDFPNVKKLLEFYGLKDDFIFDLEYDIQNKLFDSIDEQKEYKGKNLDLYYYLTGKKDIKGEGRIAENVFSMYYGQLESILEYDNVNSFTLKEADDVLKNVKKNQSVFTDEQKKQFEDIYKKIKKRQKENIKIANKSDKARKRKIIKLWIFAAVVVFWVIVGIIINDKDQFVELIGTFIGVVIAAWLFIKIRKAIKKFFRGY